MANSLDNNYHYLNMDFEQLKSTYDPHYRVLWCTIKSSVSPVLSLILLRNIRKLQDYIAEYCKNFPLKKPLYIVWLSDNDSVFSLGLDIEYIYELIVNDDSKGLHTYLELCIDVLYINLRKLDINPLISICLINGKTFGGGFEVALTTDLLLATSNVKCAFPGVQYNLLPCVGMLKILVKRIPREIVQSMLFDGKSLNSEDLLKLKLVEFVVKDLNNVDIIKEKIKFLHDKHELYSTMYNVLASDFMPLQADLEEFKELWIQRALVLTPNDLIKLNRIAKAQHLIIKKIQNQTI